MILIWESSSGKRSIWYCCAVCNKELFPLESTLKVTADNGTVCRLCADCVRAIGQCPTIG